jgi:hypothetical protein
MEAITDNCTIILTFDGIILLNSEITVLEIHNTAITASVITKAISSFVVTARAEQIPRTCKLIGLLLIKGSDTAAFEDLLNNAISCYSPF